LRPVTLPGYQSIPISTSTAPGARPGFSPFLRTFAWWLFFGWGTGSSYCHSTMDFPLTPTSDRPLAVSAHRYFLPRYILRFFFTAGRFSRQMSQSSRPRAHDEFFSRCSHFLDIPNHKTLDDLRIPSVPQLRPPPPCVRADCSSLLLLYILTLKVIRPRNSVLSFSAQFLFFSCYPRTLLFTSSRLSLLAILATSPFRGAFFLNDCL